MARPRTSLPLIAALAIILSVLPASVVAEAPAPSPSAEKVSDPPKPTAAPGPRLAAPQPSVVQPVTITNVTVVSIPDNGTAESETTLTCAVFSTLCDARVVYAEARVHITHTFDGDLDIW